MRARARRHQRGDGHAVHRPPSRGSHRPPPSLADFSDPIPRIAIVYDVGGRGSAGFNELAWEGVKRAADAFGAELTEITAKPDDTDADREERLKELADARYYPIFVIGSTYAGAVAKVAPKYPGTWFGIVDDGSVDAPNVIGIQFNEEQGSFLVGAAAALTSKTGKVGFVGAVQIPLLQKYEAGFTAGARAADPHVKVQVAYLSRPPDDSGFSDPAKARKAALGMYDAGADVIFAAAGDSGNGVIQAAHDRGLWAIGVNSDQYLTVGPVRARRHPDVDAQASRRRHVHHRDGGRERRPQGRQQCVRPRSGRCRLLDVRRLRRPDQGAARRLRRQDRLGQDPRPHDALTAGPLDEPERSQGRPPSGRVRDRGRGQPVARRPGVIALTSRPDCGYARGRGGSEGQGSQPPRSQARRTFSSARPFASSSTSLSR